MENFPKNQERIINNQVKLTIDPLLRNTGSTTASQALKFEFVYILAQSYVLHNGDVHM